MIRGNNLPSGSGGSKVIIDGEKPTAPLNLHSYSPEIIETSNTYNLPFGEETKEILNDGSFIDITTSYSNPDYTIELKYISVSSLTLDFEIKSTQTITANIPNTYKNIRYKLHQNSEINKCWLVIFYENNDNTYTWFNIYEISISSSGKLTYTTEGTNIKSLYSRSNGTKTYTEGYANILVDETGLYVMEIQTDWNSSSYPRYYVLTTYQFGTSNTQLKRAGITENSIPYKALSFFVKKGNDYYFFYSEDGFINKYLYITRNNISSFSQSPIITIPESRIVTMYEYNNEIYCLANTCPQPGFIRYTLSQLSDNSWIIKKTYFEDLIQMKNVTLNLAISRRIIDFFIKNSTGFEVYNITNYSNGDYALWQGGPTPTMTETLSDIGGTSQLVTMEHSYYLQAYIIKGIYSKFYFYHSQNIIQGDINISYDKWETYTNNGYNTAVLYSTII